MRRACAVLEGRTEVAGDFGLGLWLGVRVWILDGVLGRDEKMGV